MTENKSTVEEIRQRFDADVERFSTGNRPVGHGRFTAGNVADRRGRGGHNPKATTFSTWAAGRGTTRSNYWSGCRTWT